MADGLTTKTGAIVSHVTLHMSKELDEAWTKQVEVEHTSHSIILVEALRFYIASAPKEVQSIGWWQKLIEKDTDFLAVASSQQGS